MRIQILLAFFIIFYPPLAFATDPCLLELEMGFFEQSLGEKIVPDLSLPGPETGYGIGDYVRIDAGIFRAVYPEESEDGRGYVDVSSPRVGRIYEIWEDAPATIEVEIWTESGVSVVIMVPSFLVQPVRRWRSSSLVPALRRWHEPKLTFHAGERVRIRLESNGQLRIGEYVGAVKRGRSHKTSVRLSDGTALEVRNSYVYKWTVPEAATPHTPYLEIAPNTPFPIGSEKEDRDIYTFILHEAAHLTSRADYAALSALNKLSTLQRFIRAIFKMDPTLAQDIKMQTRPYDAQVKLRAGVFDSRDFAELALKILTESGFTTSVQFIAGNGLVAHAWNEVVLVEGGERVTYVFDAAKGYLQRRAPGASFYTEGLIRTARITY